MRLIAETPAQLRQAYERLSRERVIGIDTETTGLDPYTAVVHSVQLSTQDGSFSVLVPRRKDGSLRPTLGPLLDLINSSGVLKVGQNASFDVKMLYHHYPSFKFNRWFDTMIAERLLTAGLYKKTSLADITERYLHKSRNKEIRTTFYDGTWDGFTWTPDLIDYALEDVEDLGAIYNAQVKLLKQENLISVAQLEMRNIRVWAKMELRGIGYDPEGGAEFAADMRAKADEIEPILQEKLDPFWRQEWQPEYERQLYEYEQWSKEWETIKSETTKRTDANKLRRAEHQARKPKKPTTPGTSINLGSSTQLLPTLRATGLSIENTRKETLEELAGSNEYIDLLLEWRMYDKLANTFGEPLLESINPVSGCIHPSFNPIVATGRCSCYNPNLQQVPQRTDQGKRLRKLFTSGPYRKFVVADYSGIELVIIAVRSGDEVLLDAINRDLDLHSNTISYALSGPGLDRKALYAALVAVKKDQGNDEQFGLIRKARQRFEEIADIPLLTRRGWDTKELVAWVNNLRDIFKTTTYGTAYGLSKYGLARRLHFSIDAADQIISLFFQTYPKVKAWLVEQGRLAVERQYSLTGAMGRKRFFKLPYPVTRARVEERAHQYVRDNDSSGDWNADLYRAKRELQKEYNSRLAGIQRQGGNAPVQGESADMTKLAMDYIEAEVEARGWDLSEGVILPVHDEIISEVADEHADEMLVIVKTQMERAAKELLGVSVVVTPEIAEYWKH